MPRISLFQSVQVAHIFSQWGILSDWAVLLGCNHSRTPVYEGKCFCPDCGRGVIFQWVVLRCAGCGKKRDSRYRLRQVVPVTPCCDGCGEHRTRHVFLENPQYFQLTKAKLLAQEEEAFLRHGAPWERLRVWMDEKAQQLDIKGLLPSLS